MIQLSKYPIVKQLEGNYNKIIAIGDVHGCYNELEELLEKPVISSTIQKQDGLIIFLGDLIDRGPQSEKCFAKAMSLHLWGSGVYLLGNHEEKHVRYFNHKIKGGKNPMTANETFLKVHSEFKENDFELMKTLPTAAIWENFLFTHAGVIPGLMLNQPLKGFVRNRYIEPRDDKWVFSATWQDKDGNWKHMPGARHWTEAYNEKQTIIYGHEPENDIHWVNNTIGIDTGCVWGIKLTAIIIDCRTKEITFEQVKAKRDYTKC